MPEPNSPSSVEAHGMQWTCVPEFAAAIPLLDVLKLRRPSALGHGELVKDNPVRSVACLADPLQPDGLRLYVKRYKFPHRSTRLKHLILPTQPAREWKASRALQAAGIHTCDVLAIAVRRRNLLPREGFLVSREIPDTLGLTNFLRDQLPDLEAQRPGYRAQLIDELAALTAAIVDGGFYHHDYHAGNLLIRPQAPAGERIYVVDLHSARCRRPGRRGLLRMLGMLALSLPSLSHQDQTTFLRAFLARWEGGPGPPHGRRASPSDATCARWAALVKKAHAGLRRHHLRSRTRRCLVRGTLFTVDTTGAFRVHRRRDFPLDAALSAVWTHADAVSGPQSVVKGKAPSGSGARVLRKGRRTEVTLCLSDAVPPLDASRPARPAQLTSGRVCVKSFRRDSLLARCKDALRLSGRARIAWTASHGFSVRRIAAARPLALLESRSKLSALPDYLVMEALHTDGSVAALAAGRLPQGPARRRLGQAVASLLGQLAQEEVYHPDTKPGNLLVKETDGQYKLWLVDLDRAKFATPLTRRRWVKCLTRLNAGLPAQVTVLDRMRCLRECGRGRWSARERLQIARKVQRLSLRRRGPE